MDDQLTELKIQNLLSVMAMKRMSNTEKEQEILDYIFDKEMADLQLDLLFKKKDDKPVNKDWYTSIRGGGNDRW